MMYLNAKVLQLTRSKKYVKGIKSHGQKINLVTVLSAVFLVFSWDRVHAACKKDNCCLKVGKDCWRGIIPVYNW
ncbi:hypothetical protein A4D02_12265 [Niastella koreensis]|uniref:Uncharacterized protein n=2 Tax=Niastella koreensis TaxID=354356 RepID=G8TIA8_NIAKG|nr:hypothetical protein [Niastella koreensis]AEW00725.1 hypothetical protein Niako_4466 [Niastella koreensis GR20-10]OQP42349.1 hypothetical protein A4D02_12265 [Niastella koreensis]